MILNNNIRVNGIEIILNEYFMGNLYIVVVIDLNFKYFYWFWWEKMLVLKNLSIFSFIFKILFLEFFFFISRYL